MIHDEDAYVLVPLKEKFKRGDYSTALDIYKEKCLYDFTCYEVISTFIFVFHYRIKPGLKLLHIEKILFGIDESIDN